MTSHFDWRIFALYAWFNLLVTTLGNTDEVVDLEVLTPKFSGDWEKLNPIVRYSILAVAWVIGLVSIVFLLNQTPFAAVNKLFLVIWIAQAILVLLKKKSTIAEWFTELITYIMLFYAGVNILYLLFSYLMTYLR